ncbi:MAG: glycosyltransferase family 4 protein [Chitinispirillaceae bacterium]
METIQHTGLLDKITIVRFTHAFDTGGGVEHYLRDLNKTLLFRNNMTIIQIYFSTELLKPKETVEEIGQGRIIRIAIPHALHPKQEWNGTAPQTNPLVRLSRHFIRDHVIYNPLLQRFFLPVRKRYSIKDLGIEAADAQRLFKDLFSRYSIDILSFHCLGGTDTAKIIDMVNDRNIPFFYLNHYSNEKFSDLCIREQLMSASGVAGVSERGVPRYLQKKFVSLYDGINTDFYSKEKVSSVKNIEVPIILLPARICAGKGHEDLIEAAAMLKKEGIPVHLVFAGRDDSSEVNSHLQTIISKHHLKNQITFAGECSSHELREWYARSAVVALPSRREGFARTLLEAQSMQTPVVAYDVGGVSQCVEHGGGGYLCRYRDIDDIKTVLKKLLRNESLRKGMGEAGRKYILNNFTLNHLAHRHEQFYLNILKNIRFDAKCGTV